MQDATCTPMALVAIFADENAGGRIPAVESESETVPLATGDIILPLHLPPASDARVSCAFQESRPLGPLLFTCYYYSHIYTRPPLRHPSSRPSWCPSLVRCVSLLLSYLWLCNATFFFFLFFLRIYLY